MQTSAPQYIHSNFTVFWLRRVGKEPWNNFQILESRWGRRIVHSRCDLNLQSLFIYERFFLYEYHVSLTHVHFVRIVRDAVAIKPVQIPSLGQKVKPLSMEQIRWSRIQDSKNLMQIVKEKVGSGNSSLYLVYARPLSPIGSLFSSTTNPSDCPKN